MITPLDLQTKKFENGAFGYKKTDVDDFMDVLIPEYEALYKQCADLNDKVAKLEQQLEAYKSMEETMKNTLIVAQNTAEDLQKAANAKAELIVAEAKQEADRIISEAKKSSFSAGEKFEQLKRETEIFISQTTAALKAQIEHLGKFKDN